MLFRKLTLNALSFKYHRAKLVSPLRYLYTFSNISKIVSDHVVYDFGKQSPAPVEFIGALHPYSVRSLKSTLYRALKNTLCRA